MVPKHSGLETLNWEGWEDEGLLKEDSSRRRHAGLLVKGEKEKLKIE